MLNDKIINLVESRSLSNYTFEFESTIKQIVDYIKSIYADGDIVYGKKKKGIFKYIAKENIKYVNKKVNCLFSSNTIQIPLSITKDIDIFDELYINVTIKNISFEDFLSTEDLKWIRLKLSQGAGSTSHLPINFIENVKVKYGVINTIVYVLDGKLLDKGLIVSLRHEFNHLFEDYIRTLNSDGKYIGYHHTLYRNAYNISDKNLDEYDNAYNNLMYILFDNSEFAARASQIYSDLEYYKSQRQDFHNILKETSSYLTYIECLNDYKSLLKLNNKDKWELYRQKHKYGTKQNTMEFKNKFLQQTESLLKKFFQRICAVATLYYDKLEKKENAKLMKTLKK